MLASLSAHLGLPLQPRAFSLPSGVRAEVEGAAAGDEVLVKLVATQGAARSAHRNRALSDMLKLTWLRTSAAPHARLVLGITPAIAGYFSATSWPAHAARDLRIEVLLVDESGVSTVVSASAP